MKQSLPIVYACAGCSFAGRAAYDVAQELSRSRAAEMSCLAGVAAELPVFLKVLEGREAWVIDGCPIECAKGVFEKLGKPVSRHIRLREYGVAKNDLANATVDITEIATRVLQGIDESVRGSFLPDVADASSRAGSNSH